MIRYVFTFLAGAFVPTICIYLTGGSNRTNLVIGFTMALLIVLIPLLYWRRQAVRALVALDHAVDVFVEVFGQESAPTLINKLTDKSTPVPSPTTTTTPTPTPTPEPDPIPNPLIGDVASALINLGTPPKKAQRVAQQVASHQQYDGFEDMFKDALSVVKAGVAA